MPNIRQLDAPDNGLQTTDRASNAFADLARTQAITANEAGNAVGSGIHAAGAAAQTYVDKVQSVKEISTGGAALAVLNDNLNNQWNNLAKNADPNDDSIADTFREGDLETSLTKFVDGFTTERGKLWAQGQADNLRQHYYEKTSADTATRAGQAVTSNFDTMVNSAAASVTDTHGLDLALGMVSDATDGIINNSPALTGVDAGQLKTTMLDKGRQSVIAGGLKNMAEANPAQFLKDLQAGAFKRYTDELPPTVADSLEAFAGTQVKAAEADAKAAIAAQDKANKDAANEAAKTIVSSTVADDGSLQLPPDFFKATTQQLAQMPGASAGTVQAVINYGRAIQKEQAAGVKPTTVPEVFTDFRARAVLPDDNPNKLTQTEVLTARADGKLSDRDFTNLNAIVTAKDPGAVNDQRYLQQFFNGVRPAIVPPGAADGYHASRYAQFQQDMEKRFDDGRAAGISTRDLLDPTSKNYILGKNNADLPRYLLDSATPLVDGTVNPQPVAPTLAPLFPQGFTQIDEAARATALVNGSVFNGQPIALPAAPRNAGESAADYLKRTGGK